MMSASKGVPLTKDEVKMLVQLVQGQPIIISKATNATNNKLKDEAWHKLTEEFNASVSTGRRKPEQLELKWENLKKAARKRDTLIRANNIKTGGGKPDYIPPDDNLDQVSSILGSTSKGFPLKFGGDADSDLIIVETGKPASLVNEIEIIEEISNKETGGGDTDKNMVVESGGSSHFSPRGYQFMNGGDTDNNMVVESGGSSHFSPRGYRFMNGSKQSGVTPKQKRIKENESLEIRNKMIAEYYSVKKRKVELEIEEKLLNNEKIKLELQNLKLENEKFKELELLKKN